MANTVTAADGTEIYRNELDIIADEYIQQLDDPAMIYNPSMFRGMLKHIFNSKFKIGKHDKRLNNKNSNIDYSDINLLYELWDIYTSFCCRYNQIPIMFNYSVMTGISLDCLNDWENGNSRGNSGEFSSTHCQMIKNFKKECENSIFDKMINGNVKNPAGLIFPLKARYGWVETAPMQVQNPNQLRSIEQIEQELGLQIADKSSDIVLPDADF